MSETMTKEKEREKYEVSVEPVSFEQDYSGKFISSIDFCKLANEYFRAAFVDYIGCTFEANQGMPVISLYFSHAKFDNGVCAVSRLEGNQTGSSLLDKTRSRDKLYKEGDRFQITEDGIDVISSLLLPKLYNGGKINWKNIVTDVVDRTTQNFYAPQQAQQVTKISGIDPRNICALLWGKSETDPDTNEKSYVDYGVSIMADLTIKSGLMPGNQNANYALSITKAYNGHLQNTYEKFGIMSANSNIIR